MSYINGPRINFWGGGSTNVDTANNTQYDDNGEPLMNLSEASVTQKLTDEQVIEFLRRPDEQQGQNYFAKGGWNYYGDHQVALMNAKVSSGGEPGKISSDSDLAGLPVYLLGSVDPQTGDGPYGGPVMVDLDPTSGSTTQIYAGGLLLGDQQNPTLLVRGNSIGHSRFLGLRYDSKKTRPPYLTPGSAYVSAIFQFAFHKSDIVQYDRNNALLKAMIEGSESRGLVMRFSMFQFYPGYDTDHMQDDYKNNRNNANPSLGRIIGSIGPWYQDELGNDPPGRHLTNPCLGGAQGLAWLDESGGRLTLDLVNALEGSAIRSNGRENTGAPEPNLDYGDLLIFAGNQKVGSVPSNPEGYYEYGGLYELPLSKEAIKALKANPIGIGSTKNNLMISENPVRISSEQRNVYVDPATKEYEVELRVRYLGQPVPQTLPIQLSTGSSGTLPDGEFLQLPQNVEIPAGKDRVTIKLGVAPDKDGFTQLALGAPQAAGSWISFRKYPDQDYSNLINSGDIPWSTVYEECLRFFYVLFPAMSKRIALNDEDTIRNVGGEILKRTSEEYRDTTLYMPLTRALPPGKIKLLRAYLDSSTG